MIKLRDRGANTPTMVPYTKENILSMVMKGKHRGHIPEKGRQVSRQGKTLIFGSQPRGAYSQLEIDDMLAERDNMLAVANIHVKAQRQELEELRSVVKSDPRMAELLNQFAMVWKLKIVNKDYIPLEIQEEIMKRLPVKSLIRFRLVSKPWKSLIHSSKFIADYRVQKQNLLVVSSELEDINYTKTKYVSIADDDTFPQRKLDLPLPMSGNKKGVLIGSSHGLLCFLCKDLVVMWNPTIRKCVSIDVPDVIIFHCETMYGFGFCSDTCDVKLVKMIFNHKLGESYTVEVFTLSSGVWRSPH
nr:hypothetical protein [Tanacetum cinerariifolium]